MNSRIQIHHLTQVDQKQISELAINGYSEEQAAQAYFASGKDFIKAAGMLLNNRTFDKRFIQSFDDVMYSGKSIGLDIFGFGTNMDVIGNKYRTYILVESLEEITTQDSTKVAKLTTQGTTREAAAKDYLIQEKKRPIEEDKLDIKACFKEQLHQYNFKQFKDQWYFGNYQPEGVTFSLLQNAFGAMQKTTDLMLEARIRDKQVAKDPVDIPDFVKLFQNESWSYCFAKYPYSGDPIELENLSQLDSMALKMAIAQLGKSGKALVHLEQYLADISNMVGYATLPIASYV